MSFDPAFLDFAAYTEAVYSPPPQLRKIAAVDPFWRTLGGNERDPWGDGGETLQQRIEAAGHDSPGGYCP